MININLTDALHVEAALDGSEVRVFDWSGRQIGVYDAVRDLRTTDDDPPSLAESDAISLVEETVHANRAELLSLVDVNPH